MLRRCADRDARVFFHYSAARFSKECVIEGAEVSFIAGVGEVDGRPIAKNLQLLTPGTIAASYEKEIPGAVSVGRHAESGDPGTVLSL